MSAPQTWSEDVPFYPHRCPLSGKGPGEGRFYRSEYSFRSFDVMDDREHVLFLSDQAIRDILNAPGSPFAEVTTEELSRLRIVEHEADYRIRELEDEVAHLTERLERETAPVINLDGEALAEALAKPLAKAMKNGDKPRAPRSRSKRDPA